MPQSDIAIQERSVFEAYLFYFNCSGNTNVYAITTSDQPVTLAIDGNNIVFQPGNLSRSEIIRGSGETSDRLTITAAIDTTLMQLVVEQRVSVGLSCKVFSVFAQETEATYGPDDYFVEFWGEAVGSARSENTMAIEFQGWNGKLRQLIPKVLYSRTDQQGIYRPCTFKLDRSDFTYSATIISISSDRFNLVVLLDTTDPQIEDAFTFGICAFDSVPVETAINKDDMLESDASIRYLTLMEKCPSGVEIGQTIELSWGCDMSFNGVHGFAKFDNWENFTGIPYVRVKDATTEILG